MGRTYQEVGAICAEHQFGTLLRHSRSKGNQASGGGGVGRGGKANDNGQRHLSDREVGAPGFDALMRSREKNKTHNYTVFNFLGINFQFPHMYKLHLLLKLTPKVNTISSIPFLQMSKQRHRQGK